MPTTHDEKLAVINFQKPWAAGLIAAPESPQDEQDKLQVLRLYPGDYDFTIPAPVVVSRLRRADEDSERRRRVARYRRLP
jgi:hypothetical protein